jgi:hypothetical protein
MRGTFRFLLCQLLSSSLALAAIPREPQVPEIEKTDCCAKMKANPASHDGEQPAPKPDPDKQCCVLCANCVAGVLPPAVPFVYPPMGTETFAAYIFAGQTRSQRPPVPPPRA